MAEQSDVRRIALSLPDTVEADDRFAFSVRNGNKEKGIAWIWMERVEPKKPRVPRPDVIAIRVANQAEKTIKSECLVCQSDVRASGRGNDGRRASGRGDPAAKL